MSYSEDTPQMRKSEHLSVLSLSWGISLNSKFILLCQAKCSEKRLLLDSSLGNAV